MHSTRESWLLAATEKLRPLFIKAGLKPPKKIKVSCGFPGTGSRRKVLGECWVAQCEVFVTPRISEENGKQGVLSVLMHELVHACLPAGTGHKAAFKHAAEAVGLEGKATQTAASDELVNGLFKQIVKEIGPYPHKALDLSGGEKKQTTRLRKMACPDCGLVVRITQRWLDELDEPACWLCGHVMEVG